VLLGKRTRLVARLALTSLPAIAALTVLSVAIYAPVAQTMLGYPSGELGYRVLFNICHQYPLRSFWILDHPMAICTRCTGGYFGVALEVIAFLLQHEQYGIGRLAAFAATLFLLGVSDAILKIWTGVDTANLWRFFAGLIGGTGAGVLAACLVFKSADLVGLTCLQIRIKR
jgi:uncharacterized membrane protein